MGPRDQVGEGWAQRAGELLEASADLVAFTDAQGLLLDANRAARERLGLCPGQDTREVLTPASRAILELEAVGALRQEGHWTGELTLRTSHGQRLPVRLRLHLARGESGGVRWIGVEGHDLAAERAREQQLLRRLTTDPATGLPNRDGFVASVRVPLAERGGFVAICELTGLRLLEQVRGPGAGAAVMTTVVERLGRHLPDASVVARSGPETLAVYLPGEEVTDDPAERVRRLRDQLVAPIDLEGQPLHVAMVVGAAAAPPGTVDLTRLISEAELALYVAGSPPGRVHHYDAAVREDLADRQRLRQDLFSALDRAQFRLLYQPIVSLPDGDVRSFEALLRWAHPELGTIGPDWFIPLLEETGLIVPVGAWVIDQALGQLALWRRHEHGKELTMSTNVSAVQIRDRLIGEVLSPLARRGVPAEALTVELTETALVDDLDTAMRILGEVRRHGVRVALDDFGTGYSTLASLQHLPIDTIKLDRSFLRGVDDTWTLVRRVCQMATDLGMTIVAEGIETAQTARTLAGLGCGQGQGHLWATAMPPHEAEDFLRVTADRR